MRVLLDTNILMRAYDPMSAQHLAALSALKNLTDATNQLCLCSQNMVEFRAVATRPVSANGLGHTAAVAEQLAAAMEKDFTFLPETPAIYPAWKDLVQRAAVLGKQVHDARLVAVAVANGLDAILTFNVTHFNRLCSFTTLQLLDPGTM